MADFESMVPGIAASEAEILDDLRADLQAQGSTIANTSPFSPFFLLIGKLIAAPLLYLRGLVTGTILPGIFATTAEGTLLDLRAADMDEVRQPATKALGNLTFSRQSTSGDLVIPLGTMVQSPEIDGVVYRVLTTALGTILDGQTSAPVPVEAEEAGAAWNLGDGYYSILPVAVPGVTAVTNAAGWLTTPGADIESDDDLRERLRLKWRRQSSWHTTDTYRSLISDIAAIDPEDVFFDLNAPRGPGSADAYIITDAGIPSAALVQAADDHINVEGNHGLGDDLQVKAMPALKVAIALDLTATAGATQTEKDQLKSDGSNLIRAAFRESTAYPEVPRVRPFQRVARSAYSGHLHDELTLLDAVDWIAPAADPEPAMQLPVIHRAALNAGPAVDKGGGKVGFPATAHGFAAGTQIVVAGTDNYEGTYAVDAASSADEIVITHGYVAEAFAGTETATALVVTVA